MTNFFIQITMTISIAICRSPKCMTTMRSPSTSYPFEQPYQSIRQQVPRPPKQMADCVERWAVCARSTIRNSAAKPNSPLTFLLLKNRRPTLVPAIWLPQRPTPIINPNHKQSNLLMVSLYIAHLIVIISEILLTITFKFSHLPCFHHIYIPTIYLSSSQ